MRLIDADAVLHEISTDAWDNHPLRYTEQEARNLIEQAPTIETTRDWTPCAERKPEQLPTKHGIYKCTTERTHDDGTKWRTVSNTTYNGMGYFGTDGGFGNAWVVAWAPADEPYRADDTTGKVKEDAE